MKKIQFLLVSTLFFQNIHADDLEAHFFNDVKCENRTRTSVEISYDPTTNQSLGRVGSIKVKINTGGGSLMGLGRGVGFKSGNRVELTLNGPAGQVGNSISQSKSDPFLIETLIGFTIVNAKNKDGKVLKVKSYINGFKLTKIEETYLGKFYKTEKRSFIQLSIVSDFGSFTHRFEEKDCKKI